MHKADWLVLCALTLQMREMADGIELIMDEVRKDIELINTQSFVWWAKTYNRELVAFSDTDRYKAWRDRQ